MKNKKETKSAPILFQMMIYAAILFISQMISSMMPASFPVPTPVIGLVLLYVLLTAHVIKIEWVDSFGSAMISMIGFLFVPSGISLAANLDIMKAQGVQLVLVILLATIILLVVTAYTARAFGWIKQKFGERHAESQVSQSTVGGDKQ
ncbi:murein hydrolase transporter LrgA [Ligilactobacillus pabuli]|uniref:Murein hydrolase transporter LrgA n=1 Tax=Ligilactobacillus pabuli TaxID=2886039 RepID=A0ABQ5JH66_9LACO|nr:CidA/LrgA family protein [Ligilactobacillus pabuli]GKS81208.1 murein hydrolase transporter LrgA [Ligilactobacillus pabuli]HIW88557.1 CidA/LrgA family protein [Candidatus Ligilactobacillus excrementipullorum]